jgi:hypothetical protein
MEEAAPVVMPHRRVAELLVLEQTVTDPLLLAAPFLRENFSVLLIK